MRDPEEMTRRTQLGFGSFRVTSRNPEHLDALELAFASGISTCDTALSYMNGESQDAVSQALTTVPLASREGVLLLTKLGYIQGSLRDQIRKRAEEGRSLFHTHAINEYTDYSLAPAFLDEGIALTLERLPQGVRPVVLIQSPEILQKLGVSNADLHSTLIQVCEYLTRQTQQGRIAGFGISSQTLSDPIDSDSHLSLEALCEAVAAIPGASAAFRYVQFPLNLLETQAIQEPLFQGRTLVETAAHYGLITLVQRPLLAQGVSPMRLISHPLIDMDESQVFDRLKEALNSALAAERSAGPETPPWAHRIRSNLETLMNHEKWRNIRAFEVEPSLKNYARSPEHSDYLGTMHSLMDAMDDYASLSITEDTRHFCSMLDSVVPDLRAEATLQRKALAVYRAIPGIDHVLVGMRRRSYVKELTAPPRVELSHDQALRVLREIALRTEPLAH